MPYSNLLKNKVGVTVYAHKILPPFGIPLLFHKTSFVLQSNEQIKSTKNKDLGTREVKVIGSCGKGCWGIQKFACIVTFLMQLVYVFAVETTIFTLFFFAFSSTMVHLNLSHFKVLKTCSC